MKKTFNTLAEGIAASFREHENRPCLDVGGQTFTYSEMADTAFWIADAVSESAGADDRFVAFLAYRSKIAYASVYGILLSGRAYVPLNPRFPTSRIVKSVNLSGSRVIVLGDECTEAFSACAGELAPVTVICPETTEQLRGLEIRFTQHKFIFRSAAFDIKQTVYQEVKPDDPAYLLFTSGSTGIPKGVLVSHRNVCAYAFYCIAHYEVSPDDRFTQLPDLTFDLSVHDLFVSILAGACLCVAPEKSVMAPAKFIKDKEITFWTSVPSVIMFMSKMRMLKPGAYPTIRCSMFCGEALPVKYAQMWQTAAPNSLIENTYGPTEATVAITNYVWDSETSPGESLNGIVPIGYPFDGQKVRIINENNVEVADGTEGEICLGGSQVALGYFNDEAKTREQFVYLDGESDERWYKTGDLGKRDERGCLYYLGRIDEQVKIRGYRIELQEIDRVLRQASRTDNAVGVLKNSELGMAAIYGFIEGREDKKLSAEIINYCRDQLPEYMLPAKIIFVDSIPFNANGKINRKALIENTDE